MASICQKGITLPPFSSIANEALAASNITTRIPRKLPQQPGQFKFIMYQAEIPASSSSATTSMQGRNKKVAAEIKTKARSKISPNTSPKNSKVKKNSRKSPLSSSMQHFLPEALQRTVIPNSHHIPPPKHIKKQFFLSTNYNSRIRGSLKKLLAIHQLSSRDNKC
ncbi:3550_t:CDS:2 [Ambispora leptoticha]|uniref:3550_t:CDS:1 n=1 Tax=Ambispora leptoticha TaxID=144679 RepID=A0A9N8ZKF0_9GLOM|nr:3550_t:CDS:2 [Ambispora leptoticha]